MVPARPGDLRVGGGSDPTTDPLDPERCMTSAKPSSTSIPPSPDVSTDARAEQVIGSLADRGHRTPDERPDELVARVRSLLAR